MEVNQIATLLNTITTETIGKSDIVKEDLSNVVDIGKEIFSAASVDNYVKSLVNHIGKVIFVNRAYSGGAPSVLMDSWEYGSILEKVTAELPDAVENDSWNLVDGRDYSPNVFHKPKISAKFFNKRITFEVDLSFTERQVKESFSSAAQLNGFLTMLYNSVDKSMTVKIDSLIQRTINNMIAETILDEFYDESTESIGDLSAKSGIKAVNLAKLFDYGTGIDSSGGAKMLLKNKDFIRFAVMTITLYIDRMKKISQLFNIGKQARFTPADMLKVIMLTDFKAAASVYLQADTYHDNYTALPKAETVPYWQSSGIDYDFDTISAIHVNTSSNIEVNASGILAVIFDRDALGVSNLDRRVTTNYNAKAEFYNNFYKFDAGYFNDFNENFVVFYVG